MKRVRKFMKTDISGSRILFADASSSSLLYTESAAFEIFFLPVAVLCMYIYIYSV